MEMLQSCTKPSIYRLSCVILWNIRKGWSEVTILILRYAIFKTDAWLSPHICIWKEGRYSQVQIPYTMPHVEFESSNAGQCVCPNQWSTFAPGRRATDHCKAEFCISFQMSIQCLRSQYRQTCVLYTTPPYVTDLVSWVQLLCCRRTHIFSSSLSRDTGVTLPITGTLSINEVLARL